MEPSSSSCDELLGYHLEQACRYRAELGTPDDAALTATARRHLTAGGHRAVLRQDYRAAVSLLERAAALVPPGELDLKLEFDFGEALAWTGRADEVVQASGCPRRQCVRLGAIVSASSADASRRRCCASASSPEGAHGAPCPRWSSRRCPCSRQRTTTWRSTSPTSALADVALMRGQMEAQTGGPRACPHPRSAGGLRPARVHSRPRRWSLLRSDSRDGVPRPGSTRTSPRQTGPLPPRLSGRRAGDARSLRRGPRDPRRRRVPTLTERGGSGLLLADITAFDSVWVELWAGEPAAAASSERQGSGCYEQLGDQGRSRPPAGFLAQALYALDRLDEADALAGRAAELGASD